jgi:hypothetical protein
MIHDPQINGSIVSYYCSMSVRNHALSLDNSVTIILSIYTRHKMHLHFLCNYCIILQLMI